MSKFRRGIVRETMISPRRDWLDFNWGEIFHYRDLVYYMVRRNFLARYKQTILGPLWLLLQPLFMTLIFSFVFGRIVRVPTGGIPPFLFYLCGLLAWNHFAQTLSGVGESLVSNAHLFKKVYFPRLVVPLSIVLSNLITLAVNGGVFLTFYLYYKCFSTQGDVLNFSRAIFLMPFLIFQTALIAFGVGLWVAAFTVRYRDLQYVIPFIVQAWMYATPLIYPLSMVPDSVKPWMHLNPMVAVLECYRSAFFGIAAPEPSLVLESFLGTLVLVISGLIFFNRIEKNFVDVV